MGIESLPNFSPSARQRWESIPANIGQRPLANVWCGRCRQERGAVRFKGNNRGRRYWAVS